jgi:hypothetical protein
MSLLNKNIMKKILSYIKFSLPLALVMLFIFTQSGCKKDSVSSTPSITAVRSYAAAPGDSLLSKIGPGQWVTIIGSNLKGALQIYFDATASSFNEALFSDTSAVVLIPSVIAFPSVPADQLNTIRYVTTHGETTFSFPILPSAPTISGISNENAVVGDSVFVYGFNFFFIQNFVFAGTTITNYTGTNDGTSIRFKLPATVTSSGVVTVTTKSGTASTVFTVNDMKTGMLCNFDDINTYSWGAAAISNNATDFPGNRLYYGRIAAANLGAYDFAWYNGGRGMNMNAAQWIPTANLTDPIANYALKFEMNIKQAWTGGYLYIVKDYDWTYLARYAPWLNANGTATSFTTTGWQTITIPLTEFRTKANGVDGTGNSPATLKTLVGNSGNGGINLWLINPTGTAVTASFDGAFDNIRVVKIK